MALEDTTVPAAALRGRGGRAARRRTSLLRPARLSALSGDCAGNRGGEGETAPRTPRPRVFECGGGAREAIATTRNESESREPEFSGLDQRLAHSASKLL